MDYIIVDAASQPIIDTSLVNFSTTLYNVCLFHCLAGNPRIIALNIQPISSRKT